MRPMTGPETSIQSHYGQAGLFDRIVALLEASGVARDAITAEHLKPIDEFHIGGLAATKALLEPLKLGAGSRILDIGSGLGGTARYMAKQYGARVTGIDLTPDYVETAQKLTDAIGLSVEFLQGSALDLPFDAERFDVATLIHVGMNLPDKARLFSEVARVLKPQGVFAVYDVMRFGAHPSFPLPWATTPDESFLATPDEYEAAAREAGLTLSMRNDRGVVARKFFADMQARIDAGGAPTVGLPVLMGETAPLKVAHMRDAVEAGDIQPVEMIFEKG